MKVQAITNRITSHTYTPSCYSFNQHKIMVAQRTGLITTKYPKLSIVKIWKQHYDNTIHSYIFKIIYCFYRLVWRRFCPWNSMKLIKYSGSSVLFKWPDQWQYFNWFKIDNLDSGTVIWQASYPYLMLVCGEVGNIVTDMISIAIHI